MPRYTRQNDDYSCGPVAILNALKWAGAEISSKEMLPFIQFGCRTIDLEFPNDFDLNGTSTEDFDRVIRYISKGIFKVRKIFHPSFKTVQDRLLKGQAVAMSYFWRDGNQTGEHFVFLSGIESGRIVTVNDHHSSIGDTVRYRSPSTIKKWLVKTDQDPVAWFLSREP